MARTRSGSHLHRRGEIYYYRRIVPAEYRAAFGQVVVSKSLTTTSQTEAERLEKQHDVEFERRLCEARDASNPEAVAMSIAEPVRVVVNSPNSYRYASDELAENTVLSDEQRETAEVLIGERLHQRLTQAGNINVLLSDLRNVLPSTLLDPEVWQRAATASWPSYSSMWQPLPADHRPWSTASPPWSGDTASGFGPVGEIARRVRSSSPAGIGTRLSRIASSSCLPTCVDHMCSRGGTIWWIRESTVSLRRGPPFRNARG